MIREKLYLQRGSWWMGSIIVSCLVVAVVVVVATVRMPRAGAASAQPTANAQITVNARSSLGTIPATAFGINTAVWDNHLLDTSTSNLMRNAGVRVMRFPGGSYGDVYHWQSNTVVNCSGCYVNPNDTFDAFMYVVQATGAQPIITANYGGGTPQEAAGWVQYANKGGPNYNGPVPTYAGASATGHRYGIKYWEIGNELYGNGTYGATWENDMHQHDPATYANNVVAFSKAMKAVDPSIKIGVVLTTPGNWPDGVTNSASPKPWNDTVLPIACTASDFVIVHWYPQGPTGESDTGLLAAPQNGEVTSVSSTPSITTMVSTLRSEINKYCGAHAHDVQIMTTETNSVSYNPGKQTVSLVNALYLDEDYMAWLENGVANVSWWDLHNGITTGTNDSSSLYGNLDYGDYGMLSSGTSANGLSEPPANTPFPDYYGLQMLSKLGRAGDRMTTALSSQALVAVYAVRQADGKLALLLINKDPDTTYHVKISWFGYTPAPNPTVYFYGEKSASISVVREQGTSPDYMQSLPPYSLTTLVVSPA